MRMKGMHKLVVKEETTILGLLAACGYSKTKVKQLLHHRAIAAGRQVLSRPDHLLRAGEEVEIQSAQDMAAVTQKCPGLEILFEDESIIVIDKPAGLLTIASETEKKKTAYYKLTAYLKEREGPLRERVFIVHRLDQGTSGLLVFAKDEAAKRTLQENWPAVEKRYIAVVEGVPREKAGRISNHLIESKALRVYAVSAEHEDGRQAITNYQVVKENEAFAMVEVTLETGRKNQIRVHLADLGHPVAGDRKYGAQTDPCGRMALHASYLAFAHPLGGQRLEFRVKTPAKFERIFTAAKGAGPDKRGGRVK